MRSTTYISALILAASAVFPTANAQQQGIHMYEAAQSDAALADGFRRITRPLIKKAPWLKSFGTTSPSTSETISGKTYQVFHGCKPHDCITESYTIMYDPQAKRIVAGAFVRNTFKGPVLTGSRIKWLGRTEFETATTLGKYLF
jgi:hypothetical protein